MAARSENGWLIAVVVETVLLMGRWSVVLSCDSNSASFDSINGLAVSTNAMSTARTSDATDNCNSRSNEGNEQRDPRRSKMRQKNEAGRIPDLELSILFLSDAAFGSRHVDTMPRVR